MYRRDGRERRMRHRASAGDGTMGGLLPEGAVAHGTGAASASEAILTGGTQGAGKTRRLGGDGRPPLKHALGLDIFDRGRRGGQAAQGSSRSGGGETRRGGLGVEKGMGGSGLSRLRRGGGKGLFVAIEGIG